MRIQCLKLHCKKNNTHELNDEYLTMISFKYFKYFYSVN